MAFRFPLASVLRLREIHEQREERILTEILGRVARTREAIAGLDEQIAQTAVQREHNLLERMSGTELHVSYGTVEMLKQRKQTAESQLRQLEQQRDQQIKVYQAAHQARRVLTNMREDQHEAYLYEQARREQKEIDDLFIARMRAH
jgi:flagellar FliJ protein